MASTIPLAKPYTPAKLVFPVALSRKVDGVPVKFTITNKKHDFVSVDSESRQGKPMPSVDALLQEFAVAYIEADLPWPVTFVGEVYQRGNMDADFKETSGIVRRQYDQSDKLAIALFDTDMGMSSTAVIKPDYQAGFSIKAPFSNRLTYLMYLKQIKLHKWVKPIDQYTVENQEELESYASTHAKAFPKAEGMVARSYTDEWAPGKRTWGYQKIVVDPMIDLRVVGFEEAVSQHGEPMGMVGRVIVSYKGNNIGVGPGKLGHNDRMQLWTEYCNHGQQMKPRMAQIKHKADDSYDALRQPTFQTWRPDKDEPDA